MTRIFFVTGTDTDSGKTTAVAALMQAARLSSFSVCGLKPVASGCSEAGGVLINPDVLSLQENSSFDIPYEQLCCYKFRPAIAPHIAAAEAGVNIDTGLFDQRISEFSSAYHPDLMFIEGAGGWLLPLSGDTFMADWVAERKFPVILVVGAKLGCINHAILTRNEIERSGCTVAGYVINSADPCMDHREQNISWLKNYFSDLPLLGEIPRVAGGGMKNLGIYIDIKLLTDFSNVSD